MKFETNTIEELIEVCERDVIKLRRVFPFSMNSIFKIIKFENRKIDFEDHRI